MHVLHFQMRTIAVIFLLHLPLVATQGHPSLRRASASAADDGSLPPFTPTVTETPVIDTHEGDKFVLPLTQSLSEQDPPILGGDPASSFLINFGHNEQATGVRKHHPKTYEEVASLVRTVRSQGGKLRPMGALHSWSNIFPEDDTDVLFLDQFKSTVSGGPPVEISQDPTDYTRVTVQAGVLQSELADWADSAERGPGRFSYLSQATVVTGVTFVGVCQTASHGSGFVGESTPDSIVEVTLIDAEGEIKHYPEGDPRVKVLAACLGMCGIILEVTVRFDPSTDAVQVTRGRRPLHDLLPPRSVPINASFNPLRDLIELEGFHGGALSYAPYNSAPEIGVKLEASRIEEYQAKDRIWSNTVQRLPPYLRSLSDDILPRDYDEDSEEEREGGREGGKEGGREGTENR
ncbi:hypothetical protein NSK_008318 [Nannochloropsis salina CCMP1776]|uniref:FAD-binding PCMH-type domain-containing protein n=1 Tax=Nannochloropsis salina CCMP1776 TaxID=1027361 RepID=A0A4D9CMK3_9STRA|nr:hypothetical protein NSK_008318 [Nannochloropsis salina CCMP1776]|eukprot:TFJ80352.1 hypothetical protein NSK_008318 [Nannochloropsis salina CCMP1776]